MQKAPTTLRNAIVTAIAATSLSACVWIEVPKSQAGDVSLRVENGLEEILCGLHVSVDGGPAEDWLDGHAWNDGAEKTLKVRAGMYEMRVDSCASSRSTYTGVARFRVDGPTRVRVVVQGGQGQVAPIAGYTTVLLQTRHSFDCEHDGYALGGVEDASACCSKQTRSPEGYPVCAGG